MKRKEFIKITTSSALGAFLVPSFLSATNLKEDKSHGLGIYTIRDGLKKDFKGSLEKVAKMGFSDLELWNYNDGKIFGHTAKEVKNILDDLGLKTSSLHVGIDPLTNDFDQVLETASTLGESYIICNYLQENERESLDDYKSHIALFNKLGEQTNKGGIQFGYHNHDFEFFDLDGQKPYDLLLSECDKELVKFEMDMYWMTVSKEDPIKYFEKYPGRFPLWHVKDMNKDNQFTTIGTGIIDWKLLFKNAELAGLEQYFIEQDKSPKGDPFKDIEQSLTYLKANNL